MLNIDGKIRSDIAKELRDRQSGAWERLDKNQRIDLIHWANVADDLDAILDDIIEYFEPEED